MLPIFQKENIYYYYFSSLLPFTASQSKAQNLAADTREADSCQQETDKGQVWPAQHSRPSSALCRGRCVLSHPCCPDNCRGRYQGGCRGTGVARKGSHLPSEGGPSSPSLRPVLIQTLLKMQLLRNAMFPGDTETSPTGRATGRHLGMGKTLQAWLGFRMPEPKG